MSADNRPIVFLPGLLNDSEGWSPVIEHLRSVPVVQPDYPASDSLPAIARHVLAELPDQFDLAGHSMGGYLALEIMLQAPERVTRLALVSTSARADTADVQDGRTALIDKAKSGGFDDIAGTMARFVIPKSTPDVDERRRAFTAMALRIGADTFIEHTKAIAARPDLTGILGSLTCPGLAIGAADDRITPIDGVEELGGSMPTARIVRFETGGHHILWTRPREIAAELDRWRTGSD